MIREEAAGKRVLNLFCYTGTFSVYAAAGGAASTDSADLSHTYLAWAKENFSLNGFEAALVSPADFFQGGGRAGPAASAAETGARPRHSLLRADVLVFLDRALKAGMKWDLIIMDPPAFSNSKKMRTSLDIQRDHPRLIAQCLGLLSPGGRLWFSAGTRRFRLGEENIKKLLPGGSPDFTIEEPGDTIIDEDFRGKRPPPCYIFRLCPPGTDTGA
jgi:23S rRNA G2069 N7-methylase RlmK/C1962 C5-methylase RlmI